MLPEIKIRRLPCPEVREGVFALYRQLFGEDEVEIVRPLFDGLEKDFSSDEIACVTAADGRLTGSAMGSWSLICPPLGALNGVGVLPEMRGKKIAESCCRSILERLDVSGVRGTFLATGNPAAARLYAKLGFSFLPGSTLMLRLADPGDDAFSFLRDCSPRGIGGEAAPGDASCRLPLIPLIVSCHRLALDPLLSLWSYPVMLTSCQGLYPRFEKLVRQGGCWFQLRGENGFLAAVGTLRPEDPAEALINVIAHPDCPEAEEKMWRHLLEHCGKNKLRPLVPVQETMRERRRFLESCGLVLHGRKSFHEGCLRAEYCLYR